MSSEPFDAFVRRIAPEHAHLILAENERLRDELRETTWRLAGQLGDAQASLDALREENLALVDAMRDARALLHRPRPRAMAAASLLGDALTTRALAMLSEEDDNAES